MILNLVYITASIFFIIAAVFLSLFTILDNSGGINLQIILSVIVIVCFNIGFIADNIIHRAREK